MEHFALGAAPVVPVIDGMAWRETPSYVEVKIAVQDAWVPIYVLTINETAGAAVTCWDHQFDPILENLNQPQVEHIMRRLHPTWFACADNAARERYGDGALLEFLDPDVMNRKWMIAVLFSHLREDRDTAAAVAMHRALDVSLRIFTESSNKPSAFDYVRAAAAGAAAGGARGMAAADKFRQAAQWLPGLGG